ncbi:MAG: glucose-1-phosphate thymidylyltransferase [Candidatus Aminicenantes bacterium RBG_19FT_COMBO_58_17]|jgi:glucose-1-phosphate thymidylyltransferase|nr:MAG: glucose-1-phosphate thymidylyltransferase [Candidatus Aminicenantes bacterium RBG_19FT_COMBO_58_17]HCS47681.1 glucose-1-phosphate thymidylyltransferase [Candidatus Aminicenantes bacterium]
MKGLILSGGKGTRLRPLTFTQAKQLVPVANKPVLFYGIEALVGAGIRDIGIIVGDTKAEIREAVGDGRRWGDDVRVSYIDQPEPLGLAHAVLIAEEFLAGEPFVMYLGDNILKSGIVSLVDSFRKRKPNALILLTPVPNPRMFGVAELENGKVVRLVEKPQEPKSNLALVGVYMFDSHIFEAAKAIKPSRRNELEITDAIQFLVDSGYEVQPHLVSGWWKDTGKIEDILEANRLILETISGAVLGAVDDASRISGEVIIEKGVSVRSSTIRGPAIIGAGTEIADSYIGPFTSIQKNCRIIQTEIEHSIVLEGSEIVDVGSRIDESLIGREVRIYKCPPKPLAYRFMVGDKSEIGLK